jgi:hypothetical protein
MRKRNNLFSIKIIASAVVFRGRAILALLWFYSNYCTIYFSISLTFSAHDALRDSSFSFHSAPKPKEVINTSVC